MNAITAATETPTAAAITARAIGARAAAALAASGGATTAIDGFADAPYRLAGDEIIWMGTQPRAMHPRMVVLDRMPNVNQSFEIATDALVPWRASALNVEPAQFASRVSQELPSAIAMLEPRGIGNLLFGRELTYPLTLATRRIEAVVAARARRDPATLVVSCIALLGIGTGLTPSGDDFVGGLLFALRLVDESLHAAVTPAILSAAPARTHVISAALLADAAQGATYSVLHDFAAALSSDTARALTNIGHSSGWDLLAGFVAGATGALEMKTSAARIGRD